MKGESERSSPNAGEVTTLTGLPVSAPRTSGT